jgi:hypothetical protein
MHIWQPLVARGTSAAAETANVSLEPTFIGATTPFAVLATLFWFARVYSRTVPSVRLHWDDYLITLSWVSCLSQAEPPLTSVRLLQ